MPLTYSYSLDVALDENGGLRDFWADRIISTTHYQPENIFVLKETLSEIDQQIRVEMSSLETKIMPLYLKGHTYEEIAAILDVRIKTISNSIYNIQKKIRSMRKRLKLQ